jgi:hypothetical protein
MMWYEELCFLGLRKEENSTREDQGSVVTCRESDDDNDFLK